MKPTIENVEEKFGWDVAYLYSRAIEEDLTKEDIYFAKLVYDVRPELDVISVIAGWNEDNTSGAAEWLKKDVEEEFED